MLDHEVQAVLGAYPIILSTCRRRPAKRGDVAGRLSVHQAAILAQLDLVSPVAAGHLAARLRVSPATMSVHLARLVRLGLVQRRKDPADARRALHRLTPAGAANREMQSLLDPARVGAALARLQAGEREAVVAGLVLLAEAAAEISTQRARSPEP